MKIEKIDINQFDYGLPDKRVAKYPLPQRDQSRLLVCNGEGAISHTSFSELPGEIPSGSLLLYNNTKVIHARIAFFKSTGARIEIFCLTPLEPIDYQLMFASQSYCVWDCMVGNAKKWKEGALTKEVTIDKEKVFLKAERIISVSGGNRIKFSWDGHHTFSEVIEAVGKIPIPPYLNRDTEEIDQTRYQTVYSKQKGSVAAPTAGLHFTKDIFDKLKKKNIDIAEVTLHVGAGTFKPVTTQNALDHEMHGEQLIITKELLKLLLNHSSTIVCVGTTTMRTLESIYWLGVKALNGGDVSILEQWYWQENDKNIPLVKSINALLKHIELLGNEFIVATTEIMIVPGYRFRVVDGIITNFHQPKSTLLLLVSAFIGKRWEEVYNYALRNDFRFLSYGDSSLLWKSAPQS